MELYENTAFIVDDLPIQNGDFLWNYKFIIDHKWLNHSLGDDLDKKRAHQLFLQWQKKGINSLFSDAPRLGEHPPRDPRVIFSLLG